MTAINQNTNKCKVVWKLNSYLLTTNAVMALGNLGVMSVGILKCAELVDSYVAAL